MYNARASSQAKGSESTLFLTYVRNKVDLEPLACEDGCKDRTLIKHGDREFLLLLLCYVYGKQLRSCRDGQLTKPHFSWSALDLLSG